MNAPAFNPTFSHRVLDSAREARRYFAKFDRIIGHVAQVAAMGVRDQLITDAEGQILANYLEDLGNSFSALSYKYLLTNRAPDSGKMSIDKTESGFPVFQEIIQLATDSTQARKHLSTLPTPDALKSDMVNHILTERTAPTALQYAMAQRIYYEMLDRESLFLSQNHPQIQWIGKDVKARRRRYLIHWAVYDSKTNLPVIYLLQVDDDAPRALNTDERRWPRVQDALMAQAISELKLLTIAKGLDADFDNLHPKSLRRFHIGPMHSHTFTQQTGPLRDVLAEADGKPGEDWALAWTVETLISERQEWTKTGFMKNSWRQVFKVDGFNLSDRTDGLTDLRQALILPHRAYQVLEERYAAQFADAHKYVVGRDDTILSYT